MANRLAYIVGEFPSPTETFIAREIQGMIRAGARITLLSIRGEHGAASLDACRETGLDDLVYRSADESLDESAGGGVAGAAPDARLPRLSRTKPLMTAVRLEWRDLSTLPAALRNIGTARRFAREIVRRGIRHVHAHFATVPATLAFMIGSMTGAKVTFSAHAQDIWLHRRTLGRKIALADLVVTCSHHNRRALWGHCSVRDFDKIHVVYHGIDLDRFNLTPTETPWQKPLLLAVGRLVPKKGFDVLLEACALLKETALPFECRIIGEGPQGGALRALAHRLRIEDCVDFAGYIPNEGIRHQYKRAAVFVCPSVFSMEGDRDALPNVILEAMATSLPVVATNISAIPEAVSHRRTGLLVPDRSPEALAAAIAKLLRDEEMRRRMGAAGREVIESRFEYRRNAKQLFDLLAPV